MTRTRKSQYESDPTLRYVAGRVRLATETKVPRRVRIYNLNKFRYGFLSRQIVSTRYGNEHENHVD